MKHYLSLIKFSHTIFALPFALVGFFLASGPAGGSWSLRLLLLVVGCMVFARSAAMAFNRYLDRDIDAQNPRTRNREIPGGVISARAALAFVVLNALLFIGCTWFINPLCFALSPVALLVILGYSYTKRFTYLCHFILGLGLGLAPVGAYLAVMGHFHWIPVVYGFVVLSWVAGFDIIYALQDDDFDREQQLQSLPVRFGRTGALRLSVILHVISAVLILIAGWGVGQLYSEFGWLHWVAAAIFIGLLIYQHSLVTPTDLSRVNLAFFTTNGLASLTFGVLYILDVFI
ncbi:MAG: UbiA family prenyltransferase [Lewinellaceae bacterium]|nr:UbiA family prenyltransferase [Lewinellaceae bacterium]